MKFKKILAVGVCVLLAGISIGAVSYLDFLGNNLNDVSIVYGAGADISDITSSQRIFDSLEGPIVPTGAEIQLENYKIEKQSKKFNLGDTIGDVTGFKRIDEEELPWLLPSGEYENDQGKDHSYTQEFVLSENLRLVLFEDSDYKKNVPTIGIKIDKDEFIANYTTDFQDRFPDTTTLYTYVPFFDEYAYIYDMVGFGALSFVVSQEEYISQGEVVDIFGYPVSIDFIASNETKIRVGEEVTDSLREGEFDKLSDGGYISVDEVLFSDREGKKGRVKLIMGYGKYYTEDLKTVELDDEKLDGLVYYAKYDGDWNILETTIGWSADDEMFITEDSGIVPPGMVVPEIFMGEIKFPEGEEIFIENSGGENILLSNFPLKDSVEDVYVAKMNLTSGNYEVIGEDYNQLLAVSSGDSVLYTEGTDEWALVSRIKNEEAESYLFRVKDFNEDRNEVEIEHRENKAWSSAGSGLEINETFDMGDITLKIITLNATNENITLEKTDSYTYFDRIYSKGGLEVLLPTSLSSNSFNLRLKEEDEDSSIAAGKYIDVTIGNNSEGEVQVSNVVFEDGSSFLEVEDSDVYLGYSYSPLATRIDWDKGPDQDIVKVTYYGEEVAFDIYLGTSSVEFIPAEVMQKGIVIDDSKKDKAKSNNIIVVGGSCINSVAAEILGGEYCGEAFTEKTNVSAGEFLIKVVDNFYEDGKTVILVAGYNAEDTANGVEHLIKNGV